jgi:hypothetical protein
MNPTECAMVLVTAPVLTEATSILMLMCLNLTESMTSLAPSNPTAGSPEVGRLSVPGSTEDDLNLCPNYHV